MRRCRGLALRGLAALVVMVAMTGAAWASQKVTISVQIGLEDIEENQPQIETLRQKIARFEKEYPDIRVEIAFMPYDPQTFAIKQAAGEAPDVVQVWATEGRTLAERGWIAPLDEYLATWPKASLINPDAYGPFTVDGRIYGLPETIYVKHIMYNSRMVRERGLAPPPLEWTWDEFIEYAMKLTDHTKGVAGFAPMTRGAEGGWQLSDFIYQAGGELQERVDGKWRAVWDSPEAVRALQFMKDMKWVYDVIPRNWLLGYMDVYSLFATEKAAMVSNGDWNAEWVINNFNWDPADIGLVPMPKGPGPTGRQAGVQGGTFLVINGFTTKEERDAAWKWLDFERFDQGDVQAYQQLIDDYRSKGIRLATVVFPVLRVDSWIEQEKERIARANPDVAVIWPEEFRSYVLKTGHLEPPIEAQKVYGEALAPALQAVLSDKNADPARLLRESAQKFQREVLDLIEGTAR